MAKATSKPVIRLEDAPKGRAWYVVTTQYNCEHAYAVDVELGLEAKGLKDNIFECVVPINLERKEKLYPNYVFVNAIMNEDVWNYLRTRRGVSTILAPDGTPSTVTDEEVQNIKILCQS